MPPIKTLKIAGNSRGEDIVVHECDLLRWREVFNQRAETDRIFIEADIFSSSDSQESLDVFRFLLKAHHENHGQICVVRKGLLTDLVQQTLKALSFKALLDAAAEGPALSGAAVKQTFFSGDSHVDADILGLLFEKNAESIAENLHDIQTHAFLAASHDARDHVIEGYVKSELPAFRALEKQLYKRYWQCFGSETSWLISLTSEERQQALQYIHAFPRSYEIGAVFDATGQVLKAAFRVPSRRGVDFSDQCSASDLASAGTCRSSHADDEGELPTLGNLKKSSAYANPLAEDLYTPLSPIEADGLEVQVARQSHSLKASESGGYISVPTAGAHGFLMSGNKIRVAALPLCPASSVPLDGVNNIVLSASKSSGTLFRQLLQTNGFQLKALAELSLGVITTESTAEHIDQAIQMKAEALAKQVFQEPTLVQRQEAYNSVLSAILNQLSFEQRIELARHFTEDIKPHLLAKEQYVYGYCCFFYKREWSSIHTHAMFLAIHTLLSEHPGYEVLKRGKTVMFRDPVHPKKSIELTGVAPNSFR